MPLSNHNHTSKTPISWVERHGFSHWAISMAWMFTAWIPMQIVLSIIVITALMLTGILDVSSISMEQMLKNPEMLITINTFWQIGALALGTLLVTRLHTRQSITTFLRLPINKAHTRSILFAVLLIAAIQPFIWFLGWLNSLIPVPRVFEQMQLDQMEFITNLIQSDFSLIFILFNIAIIPAICEEIMFRGYILRTFEKHTSGITAIAMSSILFGLFHLQLANLLPLATIGAVLAILTYYTQSIYPAMVAHFVNNGSAVIFNKYFPDSKLAATTIDAPPSFWLVIPSVVISAVIIKLLLNIYHQR